MSKVSLTSVLALCAAMAACSDGPATGPGSTPALSEAPGDAGGAYTLDGAPDADLAIETSFAQLAGASRAPAQLAASARSASGSRASGHVGFPTGFPGSPIASEKYSFTAIATDPATLAAKGQFQVNYTTTAGNQVKIHGDVDCMIAFAGNTARVTGPIRKVWRDGVPSPITVNTHAYWVVVDNGEGASSPPDQVSLVRFGPAAVAQTYCAAGFLSFVAPNQEGNVQVKP